MSVKKNIYIFAAKLISDLGHTPKLDISTQNKMNLSPVDSTIHQSIYQLTTIYHVETMFTFNLNSFESKQTSLT